MDVTNTGTREGDEVPQLYVHQRIASVTQPVMQLRGFERVTLKPGEKKTVEFTVTPELLSILNTDMHRVVEPGVFDLMVGPSSDKTTTVKLIVAGERRIRTSGGCTREAPAGSESGSGDTFDDGKVAASFGSWIGAGDVMQRRQINGFARCGRAGSGKFQRRPGGDGQVIAGAQFVFAGALYSPGPAPMQPANLSSKKSISFWAKGDGNAYTLLVLTESRNGQSGDIPATTTFVAGPEWKQYSFPFSTFETDGSDLTGIGFIRAQEPGKFQFRLDQVEIK